MGSNPKDLKGAGVNEAPVGLQSRAPTKPAGATKSRRPALIERRFPSLPLLLSQLALTPNYSAPCFGFFTENAGIEEKKSCLTTPQSADADSSPDKGSYPLSVNDLHLMGEVSRSDGGREYRHALRSQASVSTLFAEEPIFVHFLAYFRLILGVRICYHLV